MTKRHVLRRDWSTCSKYSNPYRLNSQHNWGPGRQLPVIIRRFIMSYFTKYYDYITYDYDDI